MPEKKKYRIAYDIKLKRPGCPLIQAALGGTVPDFDVKFPGGWVLWPTEDMKLYEVSEGELEFLSKMNRIQRKKDRSSACKEK